MDATAILTVVYAVSAEPSATSARAPPSQRGARRACGGLR
jgi:hypothetical protein